MSGRILAGRQSLFREWARDPIYAPRISAPDTTFFQFAPGPRAAVATVGSSEIGPMAQITARRSSGNIQIRAVRSPKADCELRRLAGWTVIVGGARVSCWCYRTETLRRESWPEYQRFTTVLISFPDYAGRIRYPDQARASLRFCAQICKAPTRFTGKPLTGDDYGRPRLIKATRQAVAVWLAALSQSRAGTSRGAYGCAVRRFSNRNFALGMERTGAG